MFRVHIDVTLPSLKDQVDQINGHHNHWDTRAVNNVKYRHSSINSDGSVTFAQMKLH